MPKVIIIGASGNLGAHLVRQGLAQEHDVTAFVRNRDRLERRLGPSLCQQLTVAEGDAMDKAALRAAIEGHDALVNAAGHIRDGARFTALFRAVLAAGLDALGPRRRMWFLGGAAALSMGKRPPSRVLSRLTPFGRHVVHFDMLEATDGNWSFACPGPMTAGRSLNEPDKLIVSADELPIGGTGWARYAPTPLPLLYFLLRLPWLIVPYHDVAAAIMADLDSDGAFSGHRVGFARRTLFGRALSSGASASVTSPVSTEGY